MVDEIYLKPTWTIDSDHPEVVAYAQKVTQDFATPREKAVALYYAVRDLVMYDMMVENFSREIFKASHCLHAKRTFCIPKAVLLAACARAVGIPSRLGFADVTNHLATPKMLEMLGGDYFAFHGYTDLYIDGKWVKATPAFNERLCRFFKIKPLDFDGQSDSIFHEFSADGKKHMEYIHNHGTFADMPYELMIETFRKHYPHWFAPGGSLEKWA
ncbi:MAG: transglutaminase family protein [Turneriella sp.]